MEQNLETELNSWWNIWYHHEKDNWKLSGYRQIYQIKTIAQFWAFYNNWDKVGGVTNKHFFFMRDNVSPIWEDPQNINGGCWSFKVQEEQADELWEDLSVNLVCNTLLQTNKDISKHINVSNTLLQTNKDNNLHSESLSDEIMGLSICLKKNNNTVIKVWNKNSKNNSLKLINESILKKWGTDIIYIAHMPDKK